MDDTSWLVRVFASRFYLAYKEVLFERQELQKALVESRKIVMGVEEIAHESQKELSEMNRALEAANKQLSEYEEQALGSEEKALLMKARVEDLLREIEYLKEQVKIYQTRMGLIPTERQSQSGEEMRPLRAPRVPFSEMAAKIQIQRTEEYWRQKAKEAESGVTGKTDTGE